MAEGDIQVSRETLRQELELGLTRLELRLVQSLVSKAEHDEVKHDVERLKNSVLVKDGPVATQLSDQDRDIESLKTWRNRLAGAMAVITTLCLAGLSILFTHFHF